ncbi:MAG: hypothetical protein ACRBCJ_02795 [Hyphomicrobiaceae bacterium]
MFALYKTLGTPVEDFLNLLLFGGITIFVSSLLIFLSLLQNRLYFVFVARQINAIRNHLLQTEAEDFKNNQLYTRTDFSAAKGMSLHTFSIIGGAFLVAMYAGAITYGLMKFLDHGNFCIATLIALSAWIALSVGGFQYLKKKTLTRADDAIHKQVP